MGDRGGVNLIPCEKVNYTYTSAVDGISNENVSVVEVPAVAIITASVSNADMIINHFYKQRSICRGFLISKGRDVVEILALNTLNVMNSSVFI